MPEAARGGSAVAAIQPPGWTAETQALIDAFHSIHDTGTRQDIIRLLRGIAAELRSQ